MPRRLANGTRLVIASHNPGKLREMAALIAPWRIAAVSAATLALPEPDETEDSFVGNARLKALAAAKRSGMPALADDSGFCVAALGGAPGVVSARWAGPGRDFAAAMTRVQYEVGDAADRRAWFVSVLSLGWPDGHADSFYGRVEGTLAWPPRGSHGFGYDPMFVPAGGDRTYGEMDPARKQAESHRARAFAQFVAGCLG